MIRSAVALLLFSFLAGCHHRHDGGLAVPYDHPASPYARPAPAIAVPPIEGPDIESVAPKLGETGAASAAETDSPSPGDDASLHKHQH